MGPYLNMGWQLVITILIGVFGGRALDDYYSTTPLWTTILSFAGVILGMFNLIRTALKPNKPDKKP